MSKNRKRRRTIEWARYYNKYSHIPDVIMGGRGAVAAVHFEMSRGTWRYLRRQREHPFMHGYQGW